MIIHVNIPDSSPLLPELLRDTLLLKPDTAGAMLRNAEMQHDKPQGDADSTSASWTQTEMLRDARSNGAESADASWRQTEAPTDQYPGGANASGISHMAPITPFTAFEIYEPILRSGYNDPLSSITPAATTLHNTIKPLVAAEFNLHDSMSADEAGFRPADATEIFGEESYISYITTEPVRERFSLTDNLPVQITTLSVLLLYTYLVLRFKRETGQLFRTVFDDRRQQHASGDSNHLSADLQSGVFIAGYLTMGLTALKFIELLASSDTLSLLVRGHEPILIMAAVSLIMAAIAIVQRLLLRIVGATTISTEFVQEALSLRNLFFMMTTIIVTPITLLFALTVGMEARILTGIFVGIVIISFVYYIYRSLRLFIAEKVSILLWILYLCIVEIMPPAMILLATLRSV